MLPVSIDDVRAAHARIAPLARRTPVMTNRSFNQRAGVEAFFKCENFQLGGAFKIRGASNFLLSLEPAVAAQGVVAFSSGNHAQAVAIAAQHLGVAATLVMPKDAPRSKMEATRARGAAIVNYDRFQESREAIGQRIAEETGATLVPPFDHPWIIAGQGTCGLELVEELPDLDALVVCLGGGGLLSGCALAAKTLRPGMKVYGVEPALGDDFHRSLRAGERLEIPSPETIADGLRTTRPGVHTFAMVRALVDDVVLVSEDEIKDTLKFLLSRLKIVVEPSGAVSAAAVLHGKLPAGHRRIGVVLSGGNVDLDVLAGL